MGKLIKEPLKHFAEKYDIDISNIREIACGEKYTAVLLKNGHIGVSANQSNKITIKVEHLKVPDLNRVEQRIVVNAYFNGMLNYSDHYQGTADIFDRINFQVYRNLVMIGLFKPLLEKLRLENINIHVFDMIKKDASLIPEEEKMEYVKKADAIILSASSIANNTFLDIVNSSGVKCDIFLLGPSSILDKDMFGYRNIRRIFGAIFETGDTMVLNSIKQGYGTRMFLPFGKKVFL
jgi:uncharacterized protein (DUF4213/DUF364 family)